MKKTPETLYQSDKLGYKYRDMVDPDTKQPLFLWTVYDRHGRGRWELLNYKHPVKSLRRKKWTFCAQCKKPTLMPATGSAYASIFCSSQCRKIQVASKMRSEKEHKNLMRRYWRQVIEEKEYTPLRYISQQEIVQHGLNMFPPSDKRSLEDHWYYLPVLVQNSPSNDSFAVCVPGYYRAYAEKSRTRVDIYAKELIFLTSFYTAYRNGYPDPSYHSNAADHIWHQIYKKRNEGRDKWDQKKFRQAEIDRMKIEQAERLIDYKKTRVLKMKTQYDKCNMKSLGSSFWQMQAIANNVIGGVA